MKNNNRYICIVLLKTQSHCSLFRSEKFDGKNAFENAIKYGENFKNTADFINYVIYATKRGTLKYHRTIKVNVENIEFENIEFENIYQNYRKKINDKI